MVEYEEQYIALSRFAPELVCAEDVKCRQFEQGLDLSIQSRVSAFEITRYAELVNKAKITECDMKEFQGDRNNSKKRRFDSGARPSRQRSSDVTTTVEQS